MPCFSREYIVIIYVTLLFCFHYFLSMSESSHLIWDIYLFIYPFHSVKDRVTFRVIYFIMLHIYLFTLFIINILISLEIYAIYIIYYYFRRKRWKPSYDIYIRRHATIIIYYYIHTHLFSTLYERIFIRGELIYSLLHYLYMKAFNLYVERARHASLRQWENMKREAFLLFTCLLFYYFLYRLTLFSYIYSMQQMMLSIATWWR